jgi:hypothetical protein
MRRHRNKTLIAFLALVFVLLLSVRGYSEAQEFSQGKLSLKLTDGIRYAAIGDMNRHLESMDSYYYNRPWTSVTGRIKGLNNWSDDWQVEVIIRVFSKFSFGLAASYFHRKNESAIYAVDFDAYEIDREFIFKPEITVIMPLGFNLYYLLYSRSRLNISAHGGIGWYLAKMKEEKIDNAIYPSGDVYYDRRFWDVKNYFTFGLQGGLEMEYSLAKNLALVADFQGRILRINHLKGYVRYETNYGAGLTITESGHLHFYGSPDHYDLDIPLPYRAFYLQDSNGYVERKAILDLSGLSLRIGFKLRL